MSKKEQVAKAIFASEERFKSIPLEWEELSERQKRKYLAHAEAAIIELRSPSQQMQQVVAADWGRKTWERYERVMNAALA